jgi:pyruvate kinase
MSNITKIIATIGPASCSKKIIEKFLYSGISLVRLNGSHNTLEWHSKIINDIRKINKNLPILFDIPGEKIRIDNQKREIKFNKGDKLIFSKKIIKNVKNVILSNKKFYDNIKLNMKFSADDGNLAFKVIKKKNKYIEVSSLSDGSLTSKKGINIPNLFSGKENIKISIKQKKYLNFAKKMNVEYVGFSFVESDDQINKIKKFLNNNKIKIISKIENLNGLKNLNKITDVSDAIMIDRGDLVAETSLYKLPYNQKKIIKEVNLKNKPIIVATEMMHSMIENDKPSKSEVLDVANAILDGATCTMLSGETAQGKFPLKSINEMIKILSSVNNEKKNFLTRKKNLSIQKLTANALESLCASKSIDKLIIITKSGYAATEIAFKNFSQKIIVVTDNIHTSRYLNLYPRIKTIRYNKKFLRKDLGYIQKIIKHLFKIKEIKKKQNVVVVSAAYPKKGVKFNSIQTHRVENIVNS